MALFGGRMKTTFLLIRHGQSMANATGRFAGHSDLPLSELGRKQAEACAEALRGVHIDAVYASDLSRAFVTADAHARLRGLVTVPCKGLRETYCGDCEGLCVTEVRERYPDLFPGKWNDEFPAFRFPAGESMPEAALRFEGALREIAQGECGKTVLIGAHAAVIRAFYARISHLSDEQCVNELPFPTNASCTTVELDGDAFTPVSYSVNDYLADVAGEAASFEKG